MFKSENGFFFFILIKGENKKISYIVINERIIYLRIL